MKSEFVFLAALLIVSGSLIIGVLIYLRSLARKRIDVLMRLVDLNELVDYDPKNFLVEAEKLLVPYGIEELFYSVEYLGVVIKKGKSSPKRALFRKLEREDHKIEFGMVPASMRGEKQLFNLWLFEFLFLTLRMDVVMKIKAIHESFAKAGVVSSFIKHDVKNIAQFIHILSYNLKSAKTPQDRDRIVDYLVESIPYLRLRAERIMDALEGESKGEVWEGSIRNLISEISKTIGLPVEISGDAKVLLNREIEIALENILKNAHEKYLKENIDCRIKIKEHPEFVEVWIEDNGSPLEDTERIFEPFYSTKRGGVGIGLYQAKILMRKTGGDLYAENIENGVRFVVRIPKEQYVK